MTPHSGDDLGELTLLISKLIRRRSRRLPISPHQSRALHIIAQSPVRPARLADILSVTPRAVTDVVDGLITEGLVEVSPDPADRRAKIISITDSGAEHLEQARLARAEISEELFSVLDKQQQETLRSMLHSVVHAAQGE